MDSNRPDLELDTNAQRDSLLAMPSHEKVLRVPSRKNSFIDFYPVIKGKGRFLYSFTGRGFTNEAELVRDRINARSIRSRNSRSRQSVPIADGMHGRIKRRTMHERRRLYRSAQAA